MQVIALVLPSQLARWRSRILTMPSISQQPSMWPALCWLSSLLLHTRWKTLSINAFPILFCTGFIIGTTSILGLVIVPKVGRFVRQVMSLVSVYVLGFTHQQYVSFIIVSDSLNINSEATHTYILYTCKVTAEMESCSISSKCVLCVGYTSTYITAYQHILHDPLVL